LIVVGNSNLAFQATAALAFVQGNASGEFLWRLWYGDPGRGRRIWPRRTATFSHCSPPSFPLPRRSRRRWSRAARTRLYWCTALYALSANWILARWTSAFRT